MNKTAILKALLGLFVITFSAACERSKGKMGVIELESSFQGMEFKVKFKNTSKSMRTVDLLVDFVANGQANGQSTGMARIAPNQESWIRVAGIGDKVHYRWTAWEH